MRLNAADLTPRASVANGSVRPIRIRLGGALVLAAIELARQLVAAVDELRGDGPHG